MFTAKSLGSKRLNGFSAKQDPEECDSLGRFSIQREGELARAILYADHIAS